MSNVLIKQRSESLAAGATNSNFFAGTRFEYAPATGFLNLYLNGSQLGATARLLIGAGEAVESSEINSQNRFPVVPDDLLMGGIPVVEGQKVTVEVTNGAGTSTTVFGRIELEVM